MAEQGAFNSPTWVRFPVPLPIDAGIVQWQNSDLVPRKRKSDSFLPAPSLNQGVHPMPRAVLKERSSSLRTLVLNADYRPLSTYPLSIHLGAGRGQRDLARACRCCRDLARRFLPLAIDDDRCSEDRCAAALRAGVRRA
jgi:hypothetical protein